jgi:hypothetical protein
MQAGGRRSKAEKKQESVNQHNTSHMELVLPLRLHTSRPTAVEFTSPFLTCSEKTALHELARLVGEYQSALGTLQ